MPSNDKFEEILHKVTGRKDWVKVGVALDTPSRVGEDHWYQGHGGKVLINDDDGFLTVVVNGKTVHAGLLDEEGGELCPT